MASIQRIEGKKGVSYKITVTLGEDARGKKIRHFKTWKPDRPMNIKKMEKEVQRVAFEFEKEIEMGFQADNRQTFEEYAWYVIRLKERQGAAKSTIVNYEYEMERIAAAIGHMKLRDIRPQHLNAFYQELEKPGIMKYKSMAAPKADIKALLKEQNLTQRELARLSGVSHTTAEEASNGRAIRADKAEKIAKVLGRRTEELFDIDHRDGALSSSTIRGYHSLIAVVFAQAEKEMLVSYNPADRASPPKQSRYVPDYLQPEELARVLDCLENEPIKWKTITYLLAVTGCRRGEIIALKWEKIDFDSRQIRIDASLHYTPKTGLYEGPTKTRNTRFVSIPDEIVTMLKKYRVWQIERRLLMGEAWHDTGYLFTKDDGSPIIPETYRAWLAGFTKRHGLPDIHPHTFRHTAASILISEGVDIVTVSKMLGHANTSMTMDVYSHVIEESKRKATECIADVMLRREKA